MEAGVGGCGLKVEVGGHRLRGGGKGEGRGCGSRMKAEVGVRGSKVGV